MDYEKVLKGFLIVCFCVFLGAATAMVVLLAYEAWMEVLKCKSA